MDLRGRDPLPVEVLMQNGTIHLSESILRQNNEVLKPTRDIVRFCSSPRLTISIRLEG